MMSSYRLLYIFFFSFLKFPFASTVVSLEPSHSSVPLSVPTETISGFFFFLRFVLFVLEVTQKGPKSARCLRRLFICFLALFQAIVSVQLLGGEAKGTLGVTSCDLLVSSNHHSVLCTSLLTHRTRCNNPARDQSASFPALF